MDINYLNYLFQELISRTTQNNFPSYNQLKELCEGLRAWKVEPKFFNFVDGNPC